MLLLPNQKLLAQTMAPVPAPAIDPAFDNSSDDIDNQLEEIDERADALFPIDPLEPLHGAWKQVARQLRQTIGLDLGLNYTGIYQRADETLPNKETEAGSGDLDFFGRWELVNPGGSLPGALVFATETRHSYTHTPPSALGEAVGSLWGTIDGFTTQSYALTQLYWEQGSYEDRFMYRVGKMDTTDIFDAGRFTSSNSAFLSPAFSDTLAMALPSTGLGVAAGVSPIPNTYVLGGLHDINGAKTSIGHIERGELFAAVEFGLTPRYGKTGEGLYHVTLWHSDKRDRAEVPSGRGVAVTLQQEVGPDGTIVPFARYSYGRGGATPIRQTLAVGVGLEQPFGQDQDLLGLGISWGEPSNRMLRDQYVFEAFYRLHITPQTQLTPDIQVIFDPAENPLEDSITIGSARLRTRF
jgi:porin